jgi:hypothetical protein
MCIFSKYTIIDRTWAYSRNYSQQLYECENLHHLKYGFAALTLLFNVFENIARAVLNDFDTKSYNLFLRLRDEKLLSEREYNFINIDEFCIRKLRNYFTHRNLSAYHLIVIEDDKEIFWPLTESDTSFVIYERISSIVFNIIYKLIGMPYSGIESEPDNKILTDSLIEKCDVRVRELSSIELLNLMGFPTDYFDDLQIPESDKIRLIENSPDLHMMNEIFGRIIELEKERSNQTISPDEPIS